MKSRRKKKEQGFTLIELLAVFVILAVILGIAVGSYNYYIRSSRNKAYKLAEDAMQVAASNTLTDCMTSAKEDMGSFCNAHQAPATQYEYDVMTGADLVKYNYLDPIVDPDNADGYCDMETSYVYISNKANSEEENNNDFVYKVCLRCGDRKSEECRDDILSGETTNWSTTCQITYDEEGAKAYDGKWTDEDLYLQFAASGDYKYGINQYRYQIGSGKWVGIRAKEDVATAQLKETVDDAIIKSEAYDGLNQVVSAVCTSAGGAGGAGGTKVKIDKTIIKGVTVTGALTDGTKVENNTWAKADDGKVVLTANPDPGETPSGYYYKWFKDGVEIEGATEKTYTANLRGTYKVEITNGVVRQKETSPDFIVKIDKNKPQCTLVASGERSTLLSEWYIGDVTIRFNTTSDLEDDKIEGSGVKKEEIDKPLVTEDGAAIVVTGTVTDGVGRTNTCTITVKKDNKTPTPSPKANPKTLGDEDYNFSDNVDPGWGPGEGTVTCEPAQSQKTGNYPVTCTVTSATTGESTTTTFDVKHSYKATWQSNMVTSCSCHECTDSCKEWPCWVEYPRGDPPYWGGCSSHVGGNNACCSTHDYGKYVCPNGGTPSGDTCYY